MRSAWPPIFPPLPPCPPPPASAPASASVSVHGPRSHQLNARGSRNQHGNVWHGVDVPAVVTGTPVRARKFTGVPIQNRGLRQLPMTREMLPPRGQLGEVGGTAAMVKARRTDVADQENVDPGFHFRTSAQPWSMPLSAPIGSKTREACAIPRLDAVMDPWRPAYSTPAYESRTRIELGKSLWSVTPLELSSMILQARQARRRLTVGRNYRPRNRLLGQLHEDHNNIEDSSTGEDTETDPEEEGIPILPKYFALPSCLTRPIQPTESACEAGTVASSGSATRDIQPAYGTVETHHVHEYQSLFSSSNCDDRGVCSGDYHRDIVPFFPAAMTENQDDLYKRPAHMEWWPGDWKCGTCAQPGLCLLLLTKYHLHNYVALQETIIFLIGTVQSALPLRLAVPPHLNPLGIVIVSSELCKRCQEGRYENAGYVFPVQNTGDCV